jgi:hypothetical protein
LADLLAAKLDAGGCVTFASAAALTLGFVTVPVYEIYKVGEPPQWLAGLDLLSRAGLKAAVIPHFDNAEGGTHDTRFCYLGETRLQGLEAELPDDAFVLGVDEHTAVILDLDADSAEVVGRGVVTIRHHGESVIVPSGTTLPIAELGTGGSSPAARRAAPTPAPASASTDRPSLAASVERHQAAFDAALAAGDAAAAAAAVLAVEDEIRAWAADSLQSDEAERARATLRSMITRLGQVAERGAQDPAAVLGPFVEGLIASRERARADHRFDEADGVRNLLVSLGVEVNDSPDGTTWHLHSDRSAPS